MHSRPPELPLHRCDWPKIARLERELYGQTFHHISEPACGCDECVARRVAEGNALHAQTQAMWHQPPREHHDPIWILPPPRHDEPAF